MGKLSGYNDEKGEKKIKRFKITYVLLDGTAIKIGITMLNLLKNRISVVQTGNPRKIFLFGGFIGNIEKKLKELLEPYLIRSEWYTLEALEVICCLSDFLFVDKLKKRIKKELRYYEA